MKDYYEILGVSEDVSEDELKKKFRQMALRYHPDHQQGKSDAEKKEAEDKFKEINEAYETLSDKRKREEYDAMKKYGGFGGFGGFGPGMGSNGSARSWTSPDGSMHWEFHGDPRDMGDGFGFNPFMGGWGNPFMRGRKIDPNAPRKGESSVYTVSVGFFQAINGCTKRIKLNIEDNCDCLNGCQKCKNTKRITKPITLEVKVPSGCLPGIKLRVSGQGNRGYNGGPNGDIFFIMDVEMQHENLVRDGYDILEKVDVPFESFILGDKLKIKTLDEDIDYEIPPFTELNKILVFQRKGVPVMNSLNEKGDLKVLLNPVIPNTLTDEAKKKLEEYRNCRANA